MNYTDFMAALSKGALPHVFLLAGEEPYYTERAEAAILRHLLGNPEDAADALIRYEEMPPIDMLMESLETIPFFTDKIVVLVHDAALFAPERNKRRKILPPPPRTVLRMHCLPCSLIFRQRPTSFLRSAQSPTSGERFTAPSKKSVASWNPKPYAHGTSSIGSTLVCARWGAACTQRRACFFSMSSA